MAGPSLAGRVLYRDPHMIVLDKPAGMPVHPGPSGAVSVEDLLPTLAEGGRVPGLAHRLDRDTGGCLVLGRDSRALSRLGRLFAAGMIEKTYWALVRGGPPEDRGRIDRALAKVTGRHGWRVVDDPAGRPACTDWRVLCRGRTPDGQPVSLVEFRPLTGRTHQVRVHASLIGCPLVGDRTYGGADPVAPAAAAVPVLLHARAVAIPYHGDRLPVRVVAPLPATQATRLARCGLVQPGEGDRPRKAH